MIPNYNVEKIEISYKPLNLSFKEITLLSEDEYLGNKKLIPLSTGFWWLRSHGIRSKLAAFVNGESGDVNVLGDYVLKELGVRPALRMLDCHDLIPGDKIRISGYVFTILDGNLALCDTYIGERLFDCDYNDFETSYIRRYLYVWAKEKNITFEKS